jgi:hypothetical protein
MMEQMRFELVAAGHQVQFVSVNADSALDTQEKLLENCSFPLFQDTEEADVWGLHNGSKDDFYVYDRDGILADFLPIAGERSVTLSTPEGYANLKDAILDALGAE